MHETEADLAALQELLDRSYAAAGSHLRSITTEERRVRAADLAPRLGGMTLLSLATVTADGRPLVGAVDGIFFRGSFHFGTAPDAVRARHIGSRPHVSAIHLPGERVVHGRALPVDVAAAEHMDFRRTLLDVYVPRHGARWGGLPRRPPHLLPHRGRAHVQLRHDRQRAAAGRGPALSPAIIMPAWRS